MTPTVAIPDAPQRSAQDWMRLLEQRRQRTRTEVSAEEWEARVDLAACYRLCAHYRMTDMIYNHISLRVPGRHDHFLINAFGLLYTEVSASNLIKVDLDGRPVDAGDLDTNPAGFVIHAAIHRARPDVACVFHTHTRAGVAVSAQREGLLAMSQHAMRFHRRIGYHDYEGIALDLEEQLRLVHDLGSHDALILRNHGLLTVGKTVGEAFNAMHRLELSCRAQLAAQATGQKIVQVPQAVVDATWNNYQPGTRRPYGVMEWPAMLRKLDRLDPSYRD